MNEFGVFDPDWLDLDWSAWVSLHPNDQDVQKLSTDPGIYRVRHDAYQSLVYIGETGRSLRGRLYALRRGIYEGDMPFNDPHTASPSFWAIVDQHGPGFEVSVAAPPETENKQQRKAIEDTLIALHRRSTGTNLIGNYGRMSPGYSKSKNRSTGIRGGRSDNDTRRSFREGVAALEWTNPDGLTDPNWMGLSWPPPRPLNDTPADVPSQSGVYRLWDGASSPPLEYIGESVSLRDRLSSHARIRNGELLFAYVALPEISEKFQLSQVETELLATHWLACGVAPRDQY